MAQALQPTAKVFPRNGIIRISLPTATSLGCGFRRCQGLKGCGPWTGEQRHLQASRHIEACHTSPERRSFETIYFCSKCKEEFTSYASGGRHLRKCKAPTTNQSLRLSLDRTLGASLDETRTITIDSLAEVGVAFAPTEIDGDKLILVYPGVPSRCSQCPSVYRSTGCHVMQSMFRHMEVSHGLRGLRRWWKCSECEYSADGHKLNAHFKKYHPEVVQQPLDASNQHETISQNQTPAARHSLASTPSTNDTSSSQHSAGHGTPVVHASQQTPPPATNIILENSPTTQDQLSETSVNGTSRSLSVFSLPNHEDGWLYTLPPPAAPSQSLHSTPPPSPTLLPEPDAPTQQDGLQIENQRFEEAGRSFFQLWAPSFTACESLVDLSNVLDRCCKDWLSKARALDKNEEPTKEKRTQERSKNPRRTQSRQMQRARKKRSRQEEAKRIQRLFYIYPKRAVREVLGSALLHTQVLLNLLRNFKNQLMRASRVRRTRVEEREHFMKLVNGKCLTMNRQLHSIDHHQKRKLSPSFEEQQTLLLGPMV